MQMSCLREITVKELQFKMAWEGNGGNPGIISHVKN